MVRKILLIEDDPNLLETLKSILSLDNCKVITTDTGDYLEELLMEEPDLILADFRLDGSKCNGAEICRMVKVQDSRKRVPVILYSGAVDIKKIASDCGADGFIQKPFDVKAIYDLVKLYNTSNSSQPS